MKKTGICPICGSNEIKGPHKTGHGAPISLIISTLHSAKLETFTCASCGNTEFYADEKGTKNLRNVEKSYTP